MNNSEKMKKYGRRGVLCLLFWLIAAALFTPLSFVLRADENGNYRDMWPVFYSEPEGSLDIVAVGSSAVFRFLDNPWLWSRKGMTSYNVSVGTMPVTPMRHVIREIRKTQEPQVYLVEIRSYVIAKEKNKTVLLHRVTDGMDDSWNRIGLILHSAPSLDQRMELAFPLIAYHDLWESVTPEMIARWNNRSMSVMKGWRHNFRVKDMVCFLEKNEEAPLPLSQEDERDLRDLLDYFTEEKLPVLFFESPFFGTEEEIGKTKTAAEIIRSYGFEFLNLNDYVKEIGLDPTSDFYNSDHTNSVGARKVTAFLGDYLEGRYVTPGEHEASVVQSWDEAAAEEEESMERELRSVSAEEDRK